VTISCASTLQESRVRITEQAALTRTALLTLMVVCAVALPQHADASHERLQATATPASPAPVPFSGRVDTITHGIKLSLILPKRVYVQDMLTKVTVRVQNVSRHPVRMYRYACPNGGLFVEVRDDAGRYLYPPAVAGPPVIHCPKPLVTLTLQPRQVLKRQVFVILRGSHLNAVVMRPLNGTKFPGQPLIVPLNPGQIPQVALHTSPDLYATIRGSTPQQQGPLLYQEAQFCWADANKSAGSGTATLNWGKTYPNRDGSYHFAPDCDVHVEWHVVAGWMNQPVATIDYVKP